MNGPLQQLSLFLGDERLIGEAGVAPDVLIGLPMDLSGQFCKGTGLIHRVATTEGDIGIGVSHDDLHDLVDAHLTSLIKSP